jgi:integrase
LRLAEKLWIEDSEAFKKWAGKLAPSSVKVQKRIINKFFKHLKTTPKFNQMDPDQIVEYQRQQNKTKDFEYEILDTLQLWLEKDAVNALKAHATKISKASSVKSFFLWNRAPLPNERLKIRSDKPVTRGELPLTNLRDFILGLSNDKDKASRAIFLCMFQGGLDEKSLLYWSNHGLDDLRKQLKGDPEVLKIDLPGRKINANIKPYYTFIGKDAIDALKDWLRVRPEGTNAIFVNERRTPVTTSGLYHVWLRHMRGLGFIDPTHPGDLGHRTGKSVHEIRDAFRSQWAKSEAKAEVAEFCMGHNIDKLGYNKASNDIDSYKAEYLKALPFLNILSSGRPFHQVSEEQVVGLQQKYDEQQKQIKEMLFQMENLKAIAEREIERQTPKVDDAIEQIRKDPREMKKIEKALDLVYGKDGQPRETVDEFVNILMKHKVKKGMKIILNPDCSTDRAR